MITEEMVRYANDVADPRLALLGVGERVGIAAPESYGTRP